jgi:hypothetical protein
MANIEIAATTGRKVVLNADEIEQFRTGLRGGHLLRGDDGYDAARKIYNAMIERRPAIIARCAGAADVIAPDRSVVAIFGCCDLKRDDRNNSIIAIDDNHVVADHEVAVAAPLHEGRRDRNDAHRSRHCRAHVDGEVDVAGSFLGPAPRPDEAFWGYRFKPRRRERAASEAGREGFRGTECTEYWIGVTASVCLDICRPDQLTPLLGFIDDKFPERGRCH